MVATQNVTEDPPPATVSLLFPIAPAPVPVGLAAASARIALPAVLVASDTTDVETPEPLVLERPHLPTQDVLFPDSSDDSSTDDAFLTLERYVTLLLT